MKNCYHNKDMNIIKGKTISVQIVLCEYKGQANQEPGNWCLQFNCNMAYLKMLRKKRRDIYKELPDTKMLLEHSLLKNVFTTHEKSTIIDSDITQSDRAENFIRALERKDVHKYYKFLAVLDECKPSLAEKLACDKGKN